ncbi:MAG TPA: GTPase ObgE [Blastocatellia bacterium]|nr:GTPase ObgE [Blastocatellia bacterium]
MFIDRAKIHVRGGNGGNGVTAFRREKFVPRGGPSGGDGGRGGSVYFESTEGLNTLLHFRYNPEHQAGRGRHGEGSKRHGQDGEDIIVQVPVGTVVMDEVTGEVIHDFTRARVRVRIAAGGRGGRGNAQFATPTNRAPRHHEEGRPGEERWLVLELKLIADVGLVGLPNAGKSTLISRISAARPKIADYPFTTLEPHLGVVDLGEYKSFVVADIPGLIEGAHAGAGLGDRFLRHIERTRLLLHLVDVSGLSADPVEDYRTITRELAAYSEEVAGKPKIVVATKIDALDDAERLREFEQFCRGEGLEFHAISAASGAGLKELLRAVERRLGEISEDEKPDPDTSDQSADSTVEPALMRSQVIRSGFDL